MQDMANFVRTPPLIANIGQACYKCFKFEDKTAGVVLSRCGGCRGVSYCSKGVFSLLGSTKFSETLNHDQPAKMLSWYSSFPVQISADP